MVWTNAVGVAFTATLLSVGDGGATFVLDEDGATNTLPVKVLSAESYQRACEIGGFVPIPPVLAGAYRQCRRDLLRIDALESDDRLPAETAEENRTRLFAAFRRVCAEKGFSAEVADGLLARMKKWSPGSKRELKLPRD